MSSKKFWLAAAELAFWNLAAQGACNVGRAVTPGCQISYMDHILAVIN